MDFLSSISELQRGALCVLSALPCGAGAFGFRLFPPSLILHPGSILCHLAVSRHPLGACSIVNSFR